MTIFLAIVIWLICMGLLWEQVREEKRIEREYNLYFGRDDELQ